MVVNKTLFSDSRGNELRLSSVCQTEQPVKFQGFSAKYVVIGVENYCMNGRKLTVRQGDFVVGNNHVDSKVLIDSNIAVKGLCVDISMEVLNDIIDYEYSQSAALADFLFHQEWVAQKYHFSSSQLGNTLQRLSHDFDDLLGNRVTITDDLFYTLAEKIVFDQSHVFKNFNSLKAARPQTNGRLFNFINDARNFIDDQFLKKIDIRQVAQEARISEYHFIRLFKTVFRITPYQYLAIKRLNHSRDLLSNQVSVSDTSAILGFADTAAFSNAFRKQFGYSPSQFSKT